MGGLAKPLLIASLAGCAPFAAAAVQAAEPLNKMAASIIHAGGNARTTASPLRLPANRFDFGNRLDLAPPSLALAARDKAPESFPSFNRHSSSAPETQTRFGALGTAIANPRVPSRAEQLVRNFHREGLPVARLFQSENSLVHLGLNQKGKPGLWIVEKIH